jgi:hypothetical protein
MYEFSRLTIIWCPFLAAHHSGVFHCNHQYERLVNWTSILSNVMDYIMAMTNSTFYEFNNVIHNSLWRS